MVLKKFKVVMKAPPGKKPTRFRFVGDIRLGFKGKKVTEIVKFKEKKK